MLLTAQQAPPRPTLCYHEACAGYSSAVAWGRRVGNKRMPYGTGEVRLQAGGMLLAQGSALASGYMFKPLLTLRTVVVHLLPADPAQAGAQRVDAWHAPGMHHLRSAWCYGLLQGHP